MTNKLPVLATFCDQDKSKILMAPGVSCYKTPDLPLCSPVTDFLQLCATELKTKPFMLLKELSRLLELQSSGQRAQGSSRVPKSLSHSLDRSRTAEMCTLCQPFKVSSLRIGETTLADSGLA